MQRLIAADIPQRLRAPTADASEVKWRGSVSQFETQPGVRAPLAAQFPQQTFANGSIDDVG